MTAPIMISGAVSPIARESARIEPVAMPGIAAGQSPRLTLNPLVPIETMTAYIVQVSLGDTPTGTLEFRTIFAVGMALFAMTLGLNVLSHRLVARYRERYE